MSDKNKNRKTRLTAFFRYHKDELSGEERNSFERDLQKDPFTEEASEGFKSILPESADEDISELDSRLKTRTSGRKSFILYRIAATVAILVAITSIFIIIERNRTSKQIAVNTLQPAVLEISRSEPITEAEVKSIPLKKQSINEKRKSDKLEVRSVGAAATISEEQSKVNPAPDKKAYNNVTTQLAEAEKKD